MQILLLVISYKKLHFQSLDKVLCKATGNPNPFPQIGNSLRQYLLCKKRRPILREIRIDMAFTHGV